MAQKAVAGRHWFIIISSYLCCYLFLFPQLEGRLEVVQQSVVDERAIIIGVDSQDREGNLSDDHLESFHHQFLASGKERNTLYPPRADIDRNQTMDISPSRRAPVMLNKINLQISRWRVIPVGEGSDSDTSARLFRPWPV